MSWRRRTFIRIMLFVASCFADTMPENVQKDFGNLQTHINVWHGKDDEL